jgi:hypothetical protein
MRAVDYDGECETFNFENGHMVAGKGKKAKILEKNFSIFLKILAKDLRPSKKNLI